MGTLLQWCDEIPERPPTGRVPERSARARCHRSPSHPGSGRGQIPYQPLTQLPWLLDARRIGSRTPCRPVQGAQRSFPAERMGGTAAEGRMTAAGNTKTTMMAITETQALANARPLTNLAGQTRGFDSQSGRARNRVPIARRAAPRYSIQPSRAKHSSRRPPRKAIGTPAGSSTDRATRS